MELQNRELLRQINKHQTCATTKFDTPALNNSFPKKFFHQQNIQSQKQQRYTLKRRLKSVHRSELPPPAFHIQSTTTVAIFPPSSIKQFQNIDLTPAGTDGSIFYRSYQKNRSYSAQGRHRRELERGRSARVTGLRPVLCFCDNRQDRPAGKGMESGVC